MSILDSFSKDELSEEIEKLNEENAALRKSQAANEAELRRADETIGALRKRASEAELERDSMLSACVSAGWYAEGGDPEGFIRALRKRVEELEQAHAVCLSVHKDVESCLAAEERAEKAERERDEALESLASYQAHAHDYVLKHQENAKLQADLDAALLVCEVLGVEYGRAWLSEEARRAGEHVAVLLEKRRVERG